MFLTHTDLIARGITLSNVQLWRLERAGRFPRRVRMTSNRVYWLSAEVDAYIASRIADRPLPLPPVPGKRAPGRPRKMMAPGFPA